MKPQPGKPGLLGAYAHWIGYLLDRLRVWTEEGEYLSNRLIERGILLNRSKFYQPLPARDDFSIAGMRICGPGSLLGVQGSWAGASHSRVIPHTTTA